MKFKIKAFDNTKQIAKSYWIWFLNGVEDLEDWAGDDQILLQYAKDHDIDSMAQYIVRDNEGIDYTLGLIEELDETEKKNLMEFLK